MRKIAKLLLVSLLILFPTGELLRIKVFENVNVLPQDVIVFAISIIALYKVLKDKITPVYFGFYKLQILFISVGVGSLVINYLLGNNFNFIVSFLYALRYTSYLSILYLPALTGNKLDVGKLLFLSGGAVVLIGIPQFFFYNNLRYLFYLGWDDHLYRLFSTFLDPNFVGLFFVLYLGFLIARIQKKGIINSYMETLIVPLTLLSIYLTYSRSALLALFTLIITLSALLNKMKIIMIAIPVIILMILIFSNFRVEGLNPLRTASSLRRIESLYEVSTIIKDNMLIGVGFNGFRYTQLNYGFRETIGASRSNADAGTDNSLLFVLATTGIFGFFIFIKSYYRFLILLYKENTFEAKIYIASVLSLIVGSLFINALFYIPLISFLFLIITFRSDKNKHER